MVMQTGGCRFQEIPSSPEKFPTSLPCTLYLARPHQEVDLRLSLGHLAQVKILKEQSSSSFEGLLLELLLLLGGVEDLNSYCLKRHKSEHGGSRVRCLGRGALPSVNLKLSRRKFKGTSVYEVRETSGSSKLEAIYSSSSQLTCLVGWMTAYRVWLDECIQSLIFQRSDEEEEDEEEDDENDESSGGSNGQ
ncbi:hypothetical protein ACFE04_001427 [Oxalis oulophora]